MGSATDECNAQLQEIEGERWPVPSTLPPDSFPASEANAPVRFLTPDPINHPPHYTFGKFEVIDVIEDWGLSFHLGAAVKYIARAKHKGHELEDLKKAKWYIERAIAKLETK